MIHKKPAGVQRPHPGYVYEIAEFDENAKYLIGWPGYRTSQNKSGLGYIETQAEFAHMRGLFLVWLVTGKFRTHNAIYLLGMIILGVLWGGLPMVMIVSEIIANPNWYILGLLFTGFPIVAGGILLLINAFLSIIDWNGKTITGD